MGKQTKGPLPEEVEQLQVQLQEWRRTRKGPGPIPAPIWNAAVPLAIRFGVCRIGRAEGLDYIWLRKKVTQAKDASSAVGTTFLELPTGMVLPAPCAPQPGGQETGWRATAGAVVEISRPDGAQFRMRLEGAAVLNVIVLWNTLYMDAALKQLRVGGYPIRDEDVARLSPLMHKHINFLGRYSFHIPDRIVRGELRPLRDPSVVA